MDMSRSNWEEQGVSLFCLAGSIKNVAGNRPLRMVLISCSVIVRISAEVTAPRPERDSDGIFTVSIELNDMALPGFETGR